MRKTIDLAAALETANNYLTNSVDEDYEGRKAISWMIENLLLGAGNYGGFRYINGYANEEKADTRRFYFAKKS